MPIGQSQAMWQCKLRNLVAKFATNARGAMLLLNLIQVTESISGSVVPLAMFQLNYPLLAVIVAPFEVNKFLVKTNFITLDVTWTIRKSEPGFWESESNGFLQSINSYLQKKKKPNQLIKTVPNGSTRVEWQECKEMGLI